MTTSIINRRSLVKSKLSTRIWKTPSELNTTLSFLQIAFDEKLVERKTQDGSFVFRLPKEIK